MQNIIELLTNVRPFTHYGSEHALWLLWSLLYTVFWIWLGRQQVSRAAEQGVAYIFSAISVITWILMTYAHIFWDPIYAKGYSIGTILPFHLCYFLNLLLPMMHVWRSQRLFDWWFPWIIAACFQALFTADLDEAFPHYYNVRYFVVHATLVLHGLYGVFVYKFRPDKWTPLRALLAGNLYFLFCHFFNLKMGTNFMYTIAPAKGSILEAMGNNYVLKIDLLAGIIFYIVCSPFYYTDWKKSKA
jgi:hypothetical integral membrane protein (TIGR02206 family)